MADNQFQLILQAAEMMEEQRPVENTSEEDTDLECEEEEADSQSDSGLPESVPEREQQGRALVGRKRTHSETTTMAGRLSPTSPDVKCKQASNLHNEREKERRKDLKLAVHKLRNQLQLRKTKKATTISVLKASEQEIKDLLIKEASQNRELAELQNRQKHLTWKLETLMAEDHKEGIGAASRSNPAPSVLTSPHPAAAPITSVAPMMYMPPTPSTPHSPCVPGSPQPHTQMMPTPHTPNLSAVHSSPHFPYAQGLPFSRFPLPPLLSSNPTFPMPHHPLSVHHRPFLVMPSASPSSFPFLPHLPTAPGHLPHRFIFPSAAGAFASHPPTLLLQSPPGLSQFPFFQQYLPQPTDRPTTAPTDTCSSSLQAYPSEHSEARPPQSQTLEASHSPSPLPQAESTHCPSSSEMEQVSSRYSTEQGSGTDDTSDEHLIDVETTDLEEEGEERDQVAFLDLRTHHHKQRKKPDPNKTTDGSESSFLHEREECARSRKPRTVGSKNWTNPPALVNRSGKNSSTVSQIIKRVEPATKVITDDMFTSALEKHGLYSDNTPHRDGRSCHSWAKRVKQKLSQQPSPSVRELPRLPTVICS